MKKTLFYYNFIVASLITLMGFANATTTQDLLGAALFFPVATFFALLIIPKNKRISPFVTHTPLKLAASKLPKIKNKQKSSKSKPPRNILKSPQKYLDYFEPAKSPIVVSAKVSSNDPNPTGSESKQPDSHVIQAEEILPIDSLNQNFDIDRRRFVKLVGSAGLSVFLLSIFTKKAHGAFFGSVPGPGVVAIKDPSGTKIDPARNQPTDSFRIAQIDDATIPSYFGFQNQDGAWYIMREDNTGAFLYSRGGSNFTQNWTNRATLTFQQYSDAF